MFNALVRPTKLANKGGMDLTSITPFFVTLTTGTGAETTVVSVTGKGTLWGISQSVGASVNGSIKVVADGVTIFNITEMYCPTNNSTNGVSTSWIIPFNTSLLVTHKTDAAGNVTTRVSYSIT